MKIEGIPSVLVLIRFPHSFRYDFSNPRYGAWAESVWKTVETRIFLKASPALEYFHFAVGVIVTAVR